MMDAVGKTSADAKWLVIGAAVLGANHAERGLGCQDNVAWWCHEDGSGEVLAVAAVADGAGSARFAELGSRTAVGEVVRLAREHAATRPTGSARQESAVQEDASETHLRELFAGARRAVEDAARDEGAEVKELATTLIVALVTSTTVTVGEVGDGVLAIRLRTGEVLRPVAPQRGEFANETVFLTSGEDLPEVALATYAANEVDAFALSSDGLRLLITANPIEGTPYAPFFEDVFAEVAAGRNADALARFIGELDDRTRDDKSLVIGVRLE